MEKPSHSVAEAALVIGVHRTTLLRWIRDGTGPRTFIKPGRRAVVRIRQDNLEAFITGNTHGKR